MLNPLIPRVFTVPQTTTGGPNSDGASDVIDISDLTGITGPAVSVTRSGTNTTGTFKVEVSNDGSTWTAVGADVTDAVLRSLVTDYVQVRVRCTVNVSGAGNVFGASVVGRQAWRP